MLLMYAGARLHFPLRDNLFVEVDRRLGLEVSNLLKWMSDHPSLNALFNYSYDWHFPIMIAAAVLPSLLAS
jgi:hypothetical protein